MKIRLIESESWKSYSTLRKTGEGVLAGISIVVAFLIPMAIIIAIAGFLMAYEIEVTK